MCREKATTLARRYGFPYRSVARHAKLPIPRADDPILADGRKNNPGRPRKLTPRDSRNIIRAIPKLRENEKVSFTVRDVRRVSNLPTVPRETVNKCINKNGYRKRHCRKKGLLNKKDFKKRFEYAKRELSNRPLNFYKDEISFYWDGVNFAHKFNPQQSVKNSPRMAFRLPSEGLDITGPGRKEGVAGRVVVFFVGISYGQGVVYCERLDERINAASLTRLIENTFPQTFTRVGKGRKFLMDNCPSQSSRMVATALEGIGAEKVPIPPRSPDLNPIENMFNNTRKKLEDDAIQRQITHESFEEFAARVRQTLLSTPIEEIDVLIANMRRRLRAVITRRGKKTSY